MRIFAVFAFFALAFLAAPVRSEEACDAMAGRIVTTTGTVSDFVYRQAKDQSQFFIHDTNLPCHSDLWVFVAGRIICRDGNKATIEGRFDVGDFGTGRNAYVLLTDAVHTKCR